MNKMNFKKHSRTLIVALLDAILLAISVCASYLLLSTLISFDAYRFFNFYAVNLFVIFAVYSIFRIYSVIYSSIGLQECIRIGIATAIIAIIIRTLVDPSYEIGNGWASIVCLITFIGGLNLFSMGILGQYISKTYLETKNRPIYIAKEKNTTKNN